MSEDLAQKVKGLIDAGVGDKERLQRILGSLESGNTLDLSDMQYIETISLEDKEPDKKEDSSVLDSSPSDSVNENNLSNTPGSDEVISKTPKGNRKKIAIAGIVIAVIIFSYIGANAYAVSSLQIKPHQGNQYAISETVLHIEAQGCNPSYFPASFKSYEINATYNSKILETAKINGSTISPKSSLLLEGTFTIDKEALLQFSQLGSDFNPDQARVKTKLDASIFGVIPFTIIKDYSGKEFENFVNNGPPGGYQC